MTNQVTLKTQIIAISSLLILDFIWIVFFIRQRYDKMVKKIQGSEMKVQPGFAVLAYACMVAGMLIFVLPNIKKGHELVDSLKYGATFGFILYGVYDFTAGALIKDWNVALASIDVAWGTFVYFISAYLGTILGN